MVRETRHLWVGNLPDNIREDRIRDHFKRYGRVQSVKLLGGRGDKDEVCATVSFMDIKSAAKAHHSEQKLDERVLTTEYHEPAAIPQPNYSRFHLGSEELSSSFDRSSHFYDREGAGGYIRRSGSYHSQGESLSRNRTRDRTAYRNGPYTPIIESVVSRSGGSSSHHGSSRSGTWTYDSPSPRYPPSTPDISYQEPAPIIVHKKHSKSRSGSDSGSNSSRSRSSSASSQSGSSTCSTASSSPASEKSCSTHHSQQSNIRSSGAQPSASNHTNSNSPAVHSEDRRPLAICVRNLPARSSDTSLKDGLYHEYKKHGKVTWVKVVGQGVDRYALVSFKKPEDVDKALQVSHDKLFFGCKIEVAPYQGYDVDDNEFRPFEAEQDEFHPKATRTLFIGNLDKDITTQEIRKHFDQFGEIIDIDIKKQGTSSSYAFCQFSDISSVVRAMRSLDGEHVGNSGNRVKLGFGKSMHTSCVWVDGVAETVSEKYLSQQFGQFGPVSHVVIDRARGQALVSYEQITYAQQAVKEMRGALLRSRKLQVDYASRECQESFYDHMEKQSSSSTHPPFENSSTSVAGSPQNLRVFESPSSSSTAPCTGTGSSVPNRYNSCSRYSTSRSSSYARSSSPTRSRHSSNRFQDYPSSAATGQEYERRPSYRSYEDMTQVEENNTPTTGTGDIRHLQKERVSLLEQLEDCTSSGEEGTNRRRCNKHRRSQSGESSRPGTPLCDERPENLGPVEPRRPRESRPPDPLSLPLPRFASQVLSPRPAPPSPPASPQTHSSSSDSEPSPEWEERLRSLDEKYEKWSSGSRAGLTKVDLSTLKVRHKLLDLDLHELQPSEIVKSVLAKRSVFDEDSKRLENFGEKYEPREFVPARPSLLRGRLDLSPMSSPIVKSPSSPAAKGLQYPFPSHPPVQPTTSVATTTAPTPTTVTTAATEIKPTATTFLTNCTPARQFPLPKISSPQAEKCEPNIRLACTKVLPSAASIVKPAAVPCKPPMDIKKEQPPPPLITKVKSNTPVRRESSDDKKDESRRKSRDESVESVKSADSVKREDTSDCDKVKDSQITERRKSISEKRRSSSENKESICERTKDSCERRRGSSETESETNKRNENKKSFEENHVEMPKLLSEPDKISRKVVNDSIERRKETESIIRPNSEQEKKKDVFGVNSEKDRRRNRESVDTSDNPKHNKKVPDIKKELDCVDKRDKEEDVKVVESDKKKETSDQSNNHNANLNRHKEKKDHQDRRRDSSEHSEKKSERISPENPEIHRIKDKKANHDLSESRNSKKQSDENEVKVEPVKHKDSERRKNSENEISKEHSLFKKVFGFAERTYGHHKDRRDSDSTAVKTDDTIKHRRDHSEKDRKRDKDSDHSESSSSSKHKSRKSPDQAENNRHKERKHSESSEKRIRKELDQSDDHKQKPDHSETFHSKSRERKEERSSKESSKNVFPSELLSDINTLVKHNDRRKDPSIDESRNSESDSNDLKLAKDGESKKENEVFFERRKEESVEGRSKSSNERRKDIVDKYFDNDKYTDRSKRINDESDLDKKNDSSSDIVKYKHDRHRDNDRKRDHLNIENCRKEPKDEHRQREEVSKHKDERKPDSDIFDCLKSKDENYRYREYSRKKDGENQENVRITEKKKEEKEKKKDRESQESIFKVRDSDEKSNTERDIEKLKRSKEFELNEGKVNGDHDDYCLENIDYRKPNFDEEHHAKKEKRKDRSNWPATIGCKRRLSSQDSLEIVDDAKRSKPERRDSKDSGRSSGSSRKSSSEKHKGFTKLLEEKIKEDKEREQRKKEDSMIDPNLQCDDKMSKPAIRKEKRNSGEKRKEERKFKSRPRENGTASESDLCSGDEEAKANKRQHSIFDIVDDEPAYISMYDKVKARSTKNMQKQEEEKRQEKLKEKFHQLKASRAKREEKKRSTSYDEDSDSEKGGSRRSNKLLITSSEDEACSENDIRMRARKVLCDTSEDDTITTPRSRSNKYSDYDTKSSRKIISDVSEDDSLLKHSTPKIKSSRNISFESDMKTRKIMSDTSEDDSTRQTTPRQKPSRIQSDDSEGDLGFEDSVKTEPIAVKPFIEPVKITDVFASRPVEMNHFTSNDHDQKQLQLQSSPEALLRIPLCNSVSSEQPRKKSHKKKTKKKNYEVSEDGTIIVRKHSSKKEKKKSHRDDDDEKKSRKKKSERESSSNKREEKFEDIFGPLSDDSEKAAMSKWQVSQVYGSDSESERENIRKKEKKRKEKKLREQLDEAGRALEAKLLDTSEEVTEEPVKTKKKKRKKSRDEKIKHHRIIDDETLPPLFSASNEQDSTSDYKRSEPESVIKESEPETKQDIERETDIEKEDEESKMETDSEEIVNKEDISLPRQLSSSLSSLLDSPPAQLTPTKKPDIPGFGTEVDETIHENAVKSISESTIEDSPVPQEKFEEKPKQEEVTTGDKPTPIISQEETEDAVAALLMEETFGSSFERYSDEATKPDTPVSEPDLQIDTDTEDTFDPIDFSKATKSPEPANVSFCPNNDTREGLEERIMSLACSTEPSLKEQEKTQNILPEVKKDLPSVKTDSETDQTMQPSEKPAIIKSPVKENNKSEDAVKSATKDPIPIILNDDKPIEIDDDEEELETSKSDKNTSSDKFESSNSSLETVKSAESIELADKVIKIDVTEVHKPVESLSCTTLLTQPEKHENQQKQQEVIRHQPQLLQNHQKEQLIQQKEVLQKLSLHQLQKPQQPQQLPSVQPQLPLPSQHQPQPLQAPQQLQNQHQPQPQVQTQHQSQQPVQPHHTHQSVQNQHHSQLPVQNQHHSQQPMQNQHHNLQPVQSQHHNQQPIPMQNQIHNQQPGQNLQQPSQSSLQQKQPIQAQQFQHQQMLQKQQQSHPPQQLHHSQHQPHLHQPQIQQQQVIKPVIQEKPADQPAITPSVMSANFKKSEKIVHQQVMPQHHNTVLVHQAQAQPQTAQVVKPLSVQVINAPVIKSLDQSVVKHNQPPPKLNSPPGVHMPQATAASTVQPKPPLQHHIPTYQGRMPNPLPHLIPPHLPIKPTGQISLQAPQLTPLVKAGLATSPTSPRPLPVHTIQNPPNQKQLHVVTQNLQHSPQPPISPQNLKVIRPMQNPNIRSPLPQQQQSPIRPTAPIPLLQTVNTSDPPLNKQYHIRPPQHLHCNPSQVPHPEKVMNLSPSLPIQNAPVALTQKGAIKSNEIINKPPFQLENNIEKQNNIHGIEFSANVPPESKSVLQSPKIKVNSSELPNNDRPLPLKKTIIDEVQQMRPAIIESKPNAKPSSVDENKPLNAVIQDLTLRATNKVLGGTNTSIPNAEIKPETPRPIDQVVRELQLRKKSISAPEESDNSKPVVTETKIKEENEESSNDIKSDTNPSLKQEEESVKKEPVSMLEENKKSDEPLKTEVKEEKEDKVATPKEESKAEKEQIEVPKTPTSVKLEVKQQLSPHPESTTPKTSKDPEQETPPIDDRVIPSEKSIPPSGSGRGRGGRRRKLGRGGASGVTTRRGGRHATTPVSIPAPPVRPQVPADVYEFRDDSEEERPRLILTIKPEQPSQSSSSIVPSTRKSRRLQEKDGTRTMIDDSVEEIIRGPGRPSRRATRSTAPLLSTPVVETTRKSPRRKQAVTSQQVSADRSPTPQPVASPQNPPTPQPGTQTQQPASVTAPEPPVAALASPPPQAPAPPPVQPPPVQQAQQKQPEPEVVQAPQPLIQKESPKLLSPPRTQPAIQLPPQAVLQQQQQQLTPLPQQPTPLPQQPMPLPQQPIIPQAQQIVKPIHKLTPLSKPEIKVGPIVQQRPGEHTNLIDPVTGLLIPMREGEEGQYIPVAGGDSDAPPEKRMRLDDGVAKAPVAAVRPSVVRPPQHSPHTIPKPASPPRLPQKPVVNSTIPRPPKAHLLQAVAAERAKIMPRPRPKMVPPQAQPIQAPKPPTPMTPKAHILQAIGNAAQAREGVIGSPAPHQGSILTGSVASPPLRVHPQPMVTGASSTRFVERPGGRLAPEGGCIVVPSASPQPPPRGQVMQAGLPVPAYEASLGDVVQHVSGYGHHIQPAHYVHPQLMYQQYLREAALGQSPYHRGPAGVKEVDDPVVRGSPPLELRRRASPHDRTTDSPQVATLYGRPHLYPPPPAHRPAPATRHQVATPPHASQVPPQGDSLLVLLQRYPVMWQGLLALKNDQAAVQMHFVFGNPHVARDSLPCNSDGSTPPLRIAQRMRLEQSQLDGVARKMQMDNEHCMLLALPCGRDHMDVLQQSNNLQSGFITYLQQKQAAGIVNIAAPGSQQAAYVVHIFPASEFANDSLARIAPDLLHRVTDIAHLLIVIATV